jgi:60 kDa SS-A/Ro ribonucleoprotein
MNKKLFRGTRTYGVPAADTRNEAGGKAYKSSPEQALAQLVFTGTFGDVYYANAKTELQELIEVAGKCDPEFVAQCAVAGRQTGFMKDLPAALCAILAAKDTKLLKAIFSRVIDNERMLRGFVQMTRSGKFGRRSFGTAPKRLVRSFLVGRGYKALFKGSVGSDGASVGDCIRLVHPRAKNEEQNALFAYLIDRQHDAAKLPELVKEWEAYKLCPHGNPPDVEFRMLTSFELPVDAWCRIAARMGWHALRINLNTLARHGVFKAEIPDDLKEAFGVNSMVDLVRKRLTDPDLIARSKVFPYQIMTAFQHTEDIPPRVRDSLQDAMELAIQSVPELEGDVILCPDVSGSMKAGSVTGFRGSGVTSVVRPVDVAALYMACLVRKNPTARVLPFDLDLKKYTPNPRDSVMTMTEQIAKFGGGGTNCSLPLAYANHAGLKADMVIYVSDYESWRDTLPQGSDPNVAPGTEMMVQWEIFRKRNPGARLACIDLTPTTTHQVLEGRKDILLVGGFSDTVFKILSLYSRGELDPDHWVGEIKKVPVFSKADAVREGDAAEETE